VPHAPLTQQQIAAERRSLDFTSTSHYILINSWHHCSRGSCLQHCTLSPLLDVFTCSCHDQP
jgi:hypothetical protein